MLMKELSSSYSLLTSALSFLPFSFFFLPFASSPIYALRPLALRLALSRLNDHLVGMGIRRVIRF